MRQMIPFGDLGGSERQFLCQVFNASPEQLREKEFAFVNGQFDAPYHFSGERKPVDIPTAR